MRTIAILAMVAGLVCLPAQAQTSSQVVPGFLSTTGCPSLALTPCFVPYSIANPFPVVIVGSGPTTSTTIYAGVASESLVTPGGLY